MARPCGEAGNLHVVAGRDVTRRSIVSDLGIDVE